MWMARMLDYAAQVAELEKIARLAPRPAVRRAAPALGEVDAAAACLVCGARPARACGGCGGVHYCGEAHRRDDARWHDPVCDELRAIAEDAAFAASVPREPLIAELVARAGAAAPASWDAYLGGEGGPRRRALTDLATRPLTLAYALGRLGVTPRGRLAVHVMAAARREREVAPALWGLLAKWYPGVRVELALVGPELPAGDDVSFGTVTIRGRAGPYGRELWGELGRPDLVIGYDCGLLMYPGWKPTILGLRGAGAPFVITSYRGWEAVGEARVLAAVGAARLLAPADNPFASGAGKRSTTIANDVAHDNAFISAWM